VIRNKHLTERRIQRALDAMVDLIECQETSWQAKQALDAACDAIRRDREDGLAKR
jgi:hypothetical protein